MRHTILSHMTDEELLREVEIRNVLDPLVLELATRLEALLPNTKPPTPPFFNHQKEQQK